MATLSKGLQVRGCSHARQGRQGSTAKHDASDLLLLLFLLLLPPSPPALPPSSSSSSSSYSVCLVAFWHLKKI